MRNLTAFIISLFLVSNAWALTPTPAAESKDRVTYINATVHVGNGKVLEGAQLSFANGIIDRVGYFKMPYTGDEIDLKGAHIYPGLILPATELGLTEISSVRATVDFRERGDMNPSVRSLTSYNTDSERIPATRFSGILLAQTTPAGGLVSGTSSVVQLDAWNWQDAVVKADDAIHVNWPTRWRRSFDIGTFGMVLKEDKKFAEKVEKIKSLFAEAKSADSNTTNLKLKAAQPTFDGSKKVFVYTNDPKAIVESVDYFMSMGIKPVLVTAQAAKYTLGYLKKHDIPVLLNRIHALPQRTDGSIDEAYRLPGLLDNAGLTVGLAYAGSMGARNLSFTAGTAIAYGLKPERALQLMTLNNATILGIDTQYGSLETGKSATLFISSGDILDMRSHDVTEAYIDGRKIELHGRQQELYERFREKLGIAP
ncbi:amidohydrolase family protein [Marinicella sp. W31]|uniref:amidohydrolase family protein n=1 Tax=Marinicella sp. W31 TaxID=3023713 RepID=UPI0037572942